MALNLSHRVYKARAFETRVVQALALFGITWQVLAKKDMPIMIPRQFVISPCFLKNLFIQSPSYKLNLW